MKKYMFAILMILGLAGAVSAEDRKYELRTWTWKNGQTVEAVFAGVFKAQNNAELCVQLRSPEGKRVAAPVVKMLSDEDQAYIKNATESGGAAGEKSEDVKKTVILG